MQKLMESRQKIFNILQVESHFLCTIGGQKLWLAQLAIFLRGWR
jgi:hypothetical protein